MTISQTETTATSIQDSSNGDKLTMPTPESLRRQVDYRASENAELARKRLEALNSEILASIREQLTSMASWDGETIKLRVTLKEPNPKLEEIDIKAQLPGWTLEFLFWSQPGAMGSYQHDPYVLLVTLSPIWAAEIPEN